MGEKIFIAITAATVLGPLVLGTLAAVLNGGSDD
jgi:hypothetical protein